ncbi:inactive hydroxysteroid dehydrogenase-like protein 1 [Discoglossus pictus]
MEVVATLKRVSFGISRGVLSSYYSHVELLAIVGALYTAQKGLSILSRCCSMVRLHIMPQFLGKTNLVTKYGEWAVVTGATAGIGKAYAEELASYGLNIILISRSNEKLQRVSEDITRSYGVKTTCVEVDFSQGRKVYATIKEALKEVDVGILVNNVGVFCDYPEYFTESTEDKLWKLINVNIAAAIMMVHIVLPGMLQRKRGAIVNVSSVTCSKPCPQMAVYSSTKIFMDRFTRILQYEYGSKAIFIQSLIPYFVVTNMTSFSTYILRESILVPSAKDYARQAVRTIGRSNRTTGHWSHSIQRFLTDLTPEWIWMPMFSLLCSALRWEYNMRIQ